MSVLTYVFIDSLFFLFTNTGNWTLNVWTKCGGGNEPGVYVLKYNKMDCSGSFTER